MIMTAVQLRAAVCLSRSFLLASRGPRLQPAWNGSTLLASTKELQTSAAVRPFSDIPMPGGAVPLLGHLPLLRICSGVKVLEMIRQWFEELGPIFRLKFPCTFFEHKIKIQCMR